MIRCRLAERKVQEGFEGEPVVDLVFQFGIRLDTEPLLEQQALEEHRGRLSAGALLAGANGVVAEQDRFDAGPVDGVAELVHRFDGAVLLQALCQGEVGEIQAAGGLFESHVHLPV